MLIESISNFFRGFGFFTILFALLYGIIFTSYPSLLLAIFLIINLTMNTFFKNLFKIIMGDKNFPLFGKGSRPLRSKSCGYFIPRNKKFTYKTYGMPSGHSQMFAFITTLIALHLYNKDKDVIINYKYLILIVLTILAMYMRVYVEKCHTIQQTVVGSLFGVILAVILSENFGNPFDF